jgi:hypothetical protein
MADVRLEHPNRDKPESKATKGFVVLLLIASVVLILIVTIGGWPELQGGEPVALAYALIYLVMAYYVARWNRGVLPVIAGLAVLMTVVAAVAGPGWFARAEDGFDEPPLSPNLLGFCTLLLVPVQLILAAAAMRGFAQKWNVEVEVRGGGSGGSEPQPAGA